MKPEDQEVNVKTLVTEDLSSNENDISTHWLEKQAKLLTEWFGDNCISNKANTQRIFLFHLLSPNKYWIWHKFKCENMPTDILEAEE